jgi:RNA polymerase sigma-70 factor (ECF subfamily)
MTVVKKLKKEAVCGVFDNLLINGVKRKSEHALEAIISKYTAYVCSIVRNTLGERVTHEDIEEIASDVFLAFWYSADKMKKDNLKSYLGTIARNMSLNRLRNFEETETLNDDISDGDYNESLEDIVISDDEREAVGKAVMSMNSPDREIFLRYYYNAETASAVAVSMGLTEATVKHRLVRGREKLKEMVLQGEVYS